MRSSYHADHAVWSLHEILTMDCAPLWLFFESQPWVPVKLRLFMALPRSLKHESFESAGPSTVWAQHLVVWLWDFNCPTKKGSSARCCGISAYSLNSMENSPCPQAHQHKHSTVFYDVSFMCFLHCNYISQQSYQQKLVKIMWWSNITSLRHGSQVRRVAKPQHGPFPPQLEALHAH